MSESGTNIEITDGAAIPRKRDLGLFSAWRICFFGSVATFLYLIIFTPDPYLKIAKFLPDGVLVTIEVTFASIVFALTLGLITGIGRV